MTSLQQRAELHRQIWQIANDVRGSVDGWDFKQYVLGALFTVLSVKTLSVTLKPEMTESGTPRLMTVLSRTILKTMRSERRAILFTPASSFAMWQRKQTPMTG